MNEDFSTGNDNADSLACLSVVNLRCGYGQKRVVNGVSLHVMPGEIVALVGPNGAGKSTLLKAIFGLLRVQNGEVRLSGSVIQNHSPSALVRCGVAYVPQGSRVFPGMSVLENLQMGGFTCANRNDIQDQVARMEDLFPILAERRHQLACKLSGGEKQVLALTQALMTQPQILLLDEPSLGLSPQATSSALSAVRQLNKDLGAAVLLVEQNVREALQIADRVYVLRQGKVALEALSTDVTMGNLRSAFLG